jgi:hypothetical protein
MSSREVGRSADQQPTYADDERHKRHSSKAEKAVFNTIHATETEHPRRIARQHHSAFGYACQRG